MADAADLKSVVRKDVRVRLPPSAPVKNQSFTGTHRLFFNSAILVLCAYGVPSLVTR